MSSLIQISWPLNFHFNCLGSHNKLIRMYCALCCDYYPRHKMVANSSLNKKFVQDKHIEG
jgi:hypothetical protein